MSNIGKVFTLTSILLVFRLEVIAQFCNGYFPSENGLMISYATYDKKGKPLATAETRYVVKDTNSQRTRIQAEVYAKSAKGRVVGNYSYWITCILDEQRVDLGLILGSTIPADSSRIQMKVQAENLIYSNSLVPGNTLPNAYAKIETSFPTNPINIRVYNRRIVGEEVLKTKVGELSCVIIQEESEAIQSGKARVSISKSWFSKGYGLVKHECFIDGEFFQSGEILEVTKP